jgi:transglutaminase superfamily protein
LLATDQRRFPLSLTAPRPQRHRVVGCCRDFTLLTVAALRHQRVPARSRVGFASYFDQDFHCDHVVAEYWNGQRWVLVDAQLEPTPTLPFDTCDIPHLVGTNPSSTTPFATAAQVWTAYRRGLLDIERFGVSPDHPLRGGWFVRNYVLHELAHRQRDELLLWDVWGAMATDLDRDLDLIDQVATLLIAADDGDSSAE